MPAIRNTHVQDEALREELALLTEMVMATSLSPGRLTQQQVDEALGVSGAEDQSGRTAQTPIRRRARRSQARMAARTTAPR